MLPKRVPPVTIRPLERYAPPRVTAPPVVVPRVVARRLAPAPRVSPREDAIVLSGTPPPREAVWPEVAVRLDRPDGVLLAARVDRGVA